MDVNEIASVEAEGKNEKLLMPFMELQRLVMGECVSCTGSFQTDGSCVICTKKEEVPDCILPRLIDAIADLKNPKRYELSMTATPEWIQQHRANQGPLPGSVKAKKEAVSG